MESGSPHRCFFATTSASGFPHLSALTAIFLLLLSVDELFVLLSNCTGPFVFVTVPEGLLPHACVGGAGKVGRALLRPALPDLLADDACSCLLMRRSSLRPADAVRSPCPPLVAAPEEEEEEDDSVCPRRHAPLSSRGMLFDW